jgi:hypothetical protein
MSPVRMREIEPHVRGVAVLTGGWVRTFDRLVICAGL